MLNLARDLQLPVDAVTQTFAIFGKRGAGKSNTATVMAEEMFNVAPFVVLTPLDNWWGLKASFDGKGVGLKVYVFGGDHGDLPLDPEAGELMARLFIEHRISMVICMKGWSVAQRAKFVTAFALYLLGHNGKVPIHVFLEEADAFIPQRPYKGEEAMLGAMDRMVRWGRGEGIGCTLITQRSAKVNKDVTTQCETLIAHRTIGPQDRDAIDQWIKYHADQDKRVEVLSKIAGLPDGTAIVWSPEWLNLFGIYKIRRRQTFDSASTPKVGEKRIEPKHLAVPDLAKLREQLAFSIAKAQLNDPKELRRQISDLKKQLAQIQSNKDTKPQIVEKRVEIIPDEVRNLFGFVRQFEIEMERQTKGLQALLERATDVLQSSGKEVMPHRARIGSDKSAGVQRPAEAPASTDGRLSGPQQRIIDSVAWLHSLTVDQPSRAQVAFISRMKPTAGHFNNLVGSLRTKELIDYPTTGKIVLTDRGMKLANYPDEALSERGLQERILSVLSGPQQRIIEAVIPLGSEGTSREELARMVGMNSNAGHFNNLLGSLRTLGLIDYPQRGMVRPTTLLYLEI